jgi:hypothetical protein
MLAGDNPTTHQAAARSAVERGHAFLSHIGRTARRWDRCSRRYLGWVELAACVIFIRAEAHGFFR